MERTGVLVTGSHRSGSTWLGRMLASADELHYVQEPFNIVAVQRWLDPRPERQFLHLDDARGAAYVDGLQRVVDLRYPLLAHLRTRPDLRTARRITRIALEAERARRRGARPLVKDPIAIFSTEWLQTRFGLEPVVLVREPVAFVGSLKERNWTFDFHHWSRQPSLMADVAGRWADEVRAMATDPGDVVEQGILQWNVFYDFVADLRERRPDVIVVSYERLAEDPTDRVPDLFDRLGLGYGPAQREAVEQLTSGRGNGPSGGSSAIDVHRRSSEALGTWRERLDDGEIAAVRAGTAAVADRLDDLL